MPDPSPSVKAGGKEIVVAARPAFYNRAQDPGNYFLYTEIGRRGVGVVEGTIQNIFFRRYDVLHVHWPDNVLRSKSSLATLAKLGALFALLIFARVTGRDLVWTAHNSVSHEKHHPYLEKFFWKLFGFLLTGIIVHSQAEYDRLRVQPEFQGVDDWAVIPLSAFTGMYSVPPADRPATAAQDGIRVTYAGRLRRYKGAEEVIQCFKALKPSTASLTVAGKPEDQALANEMKAMVQGRPDISLRLGFLTPEELCQLLLSSDLVVLPFKWVTNSGSTLLALTYGAKVLVPNTPYFRELQAEFGDSWVQLFEHPLTPSALEGAIEWSRDRHGLVLPVIPEARRLDSAALRHVEFYQRLQS